MKTDTCGRGLTFNVSALWLLSNQINHKVFSICFYLFSFKFFLQLLRISLVPLIFPYSAQILLENAIFCRQIARLKNRLFCSKFCRQNLSKPRWRKCGNTLSNVKGFIILRPGEGLTSSNKDNSVKFLVKKYNNAFRGISFLRIREKPFSQISYW